MVVFSTKADYSIIILAELARSHGYQSLGKIAKDRRLPYRYISRIAAELKKAGLIESKEGVTGGYRLTKKPENITALEVLRVFEDDIGTARCTIHGNTCPREETCLMKPKWKDMQKEITHVVERYTLADFM